MSLYDCRRRATHALPPRDVSQGKASSIIKERLSWANGYAEAVAVVAGFDFDL
jgi:hypothetical protein